MTLRDYQTDALAGVRSALGSGQSVVLQLPTGAGKTITAAELIREEAQHGPVWFVCHRREIIRQASRALSGLGVEHDVIAPNPQKLKLGPGHVPGAAVSIASVQTLLSRHGLPNPRLVVWDECHHAAAKTWAGLIKGLPDTMHVGLTATPERTDGKGLKDWFDALVCGPSIKDLIEAGRLSKVRYFAPSIPDLTAARLAMGDYRKDDADAVMSTPVLIGNAVDEYRRHAPGSRAILFATSREASKVAAERFNAAGVAAKHIDGTTPLDERDAAIADLGAGRLRVLTNVEVFTEGVDVPTVETVILMRPTKSLTLNLQMIGRGMRVAEGKSALTVFDHAGNVQEHGIPGEIDWPWSIEGGAREQGRAAAARNGEAIRRCPQCSHAHRMAPSCEECGYEYQNWREMGEYDGLLGQMDAGSVVISTAAKALGYSNGTATAWCKDESAPIAKIGGRYFVKIEELRKWLKENGSKPYGSKVKDGEEAYVPDGAVSVTSYARKNGISVDIVMKNAPLESKIKIRARNFIIEEKAENWLLYTKSVKQDPVKTSLSWWCEYGGPKSVERWKLIGVEFEDPKKIKMSDYLEALNIYKKSCNSKGHIVRNNTSEIRSEFGRRLHISQQSPISKLAKLGLPCDSNGWVHIQKGLEWVRDNTNIAIPPGAWPTKKESQDA